MMPADIAQGIAKDAQENLDGLDVVNVPTYGGSAPWYVGQTTEGLLEGVIRYQMYLEDSVAHDPEPDITINWQPNGDYTASLSAPAAKAAFRYTCVWVNSAPTMIRIVLKLEDPAGRLPEGQWYEYVVGAP